MLTIDSNKLTTMLSINTLSRYLYIAIKEINEIRTQRNRMYLPSL